MSENDTKLTDAALAAIEAEIVEFNAAHMADAEAKELRHAQEHRFVETRVWNAEQRLLKRVPELLAHARALEAELKNKTTALAQLAALHDDDMGEFMRLAGE